MCRINEELSEFVKKRIKFIRLIYFLNLLLTGIVIFFIYYENITKLFIIFYVSGFLFSSLLWYYFQYYWNQDKLIIAKRIYKSIQILQYPFMMFSLNGTCHYVKMNNENIEHFDWNYYVEETGNINKIYSIKQMFRTDFWISYINNHSSEINDNELKKYLTLIKKGLINLYKILLFIF